MMNSITLVGCGNIGSRHLQGLAKLSKKVKIKIVEPNKSAVILAKKRLEEIPDYHKHDYEWHTSLDDLSKSEIVIIATLSRGRLKIIHELLKKENKKFLIEKMVCQSKQEYDFILKEFKKFSATGWVNTSRRYFKSYNKIKSIFGKKYPINMTIIAGNLGLGSNAIHFVDLFSWFNEKNILELNGDFLHHIIHKNKRSKEFFEFSGTIFGKISNEATLTISFSSYENMPLTVDISTKNKRIIVNESEEKILPIQISSTIDFKTEYQSTLTTIIVKDILTKNNCKLPLLNDSYLLHCEIFKIFNKHLNKILKKRFIVCPIT